jgi:hypothetical protein
MVGATGSNQTAKARSTATAFAFNASTNVLTANNLTSTTSVSAAGASGFFSTTFATNARNPIWRFGNADTFGLSYFQGTSGVSPAGGGDTLGFHFGTATAAASLLQLNNGSGAVINGTLGVTGQFQSTQANSTTTGGGQIYLNGATGNRIDFNTNGVAAPTLTTRSAGTKIVLYPSSNLATEVDAGFGIDNNTLWSSIWTTSQSFKWYAGTTNIATLSGTGVLSIFTNGSTLYGPNSTWGASLRVGGNGNADTTNASVVTTNGNLHIDAASGGSATYLNFYKGNNGVAFGNGSGAGAVAWMGPDGDLWKGGADNTGSVYWHAGNDGAGSGLDADLLDGLGQTTANTASTIVARGGGGNFDAGAINVTGGVSNTDNGIRVHSPGGASYATTTSTVTGAIKIRIPAAALGSNTMLSFRVSVYQYNTGLSQQFLISGYNYSVSDTWYNVSAICLTDSGSEFTVRFGSDGTSQCVYIGELASTWSYPQVFVTDFCGGYSGFSQANWATGWNISFETTAFANVTATRSAVRSWNANNDGAGSGLDADLLDGLNSATANTASTIVARDGSGNFSAGTISSSLLASVDQGIVNQNNGNAATWYGRILSKNSTSDKSSFLGTYGSIAGVFAHNNALSAWADLYVNTTSGSDGGNVYIAGGANVAIGGVSASYKLDVTGSIRATTQLLSTGNLAAWNTTTPGTGVGGLHLGAASGTSNVGPAITFGARDTSSGTNAQAGIYINSDGTYGTRMYFATTDSYAAGSKVAMSISETGLVNFVRTNPTSAGNAIWHAGNDGAGSGLDADLLDGIGAVQLFNNMGDAHGTRSAFDATTPSYDFGFRFVQGSGNGPATGGTQYYSWYIGIGSDYLATGAGSYGAMFAVDRNVATPYLSVRYNENNSFGAWRKISAGYSDTSGTSGNLSNFKTFWAGFLTSIIYYQIAQLPASGASSGDGIYIEVVSNTSSISGKCKLKVGLGQRGGFWYVKSYEGSGQKFHIRVYQPSAGGVSNVYLYNTVASYDAATVTYYNYGWGSSNGIGATLYENPSGSGSTPAGTLIFDSNNESIYPVNDSLSTGAINSNAIVSSGTGTAGGFQNVTFAAGRNRIWSFGNADAYGLSYFQGGPDYIGLHFGTATQAASQFWVSDSGISQTSGSSRAPIFYDSNNTAYYTDPASTSVLNVLTLGGRSTTNAMYYQGFTLDANTMDSNSTGFTYAVNAPSVGPIVRFSTGGGYDLWLNAPYNGGGTNLYFRTRNGDTATLNSWQTVWNSANDGAGSGLDADLLDGISSGSFLRSDTSTTWSGSAAGIFTIGLPAGALGSTVGAVNTLQIYQPTVNTDAFLSFHVAGDYAAHFGLDGTANDLFYGGWSLGGTKFKVWHSGNDGTGSGLDADLWDGYQLSTQGNWSTNSAINIVTGLLAWKNYGNSHVIFDASNSTSPSGGAVNNTNSQVAWSAAYPTLMGWNGSNTFGVRVDSCRLADTASAVDFNNLTNKASGTGTYTTSGDFRAPIFYDSNNTGYYVDPASTSYLNLVRCNNWLYLDQNYGHSIVGLYSAFRYQGVFAMGDAYKLPADGTSTGNLYGIAWSHPNAGGIAGNLNTHGALITENGSFLAALSGSIRCRDDMRAQIFYDSNNTAYYTDPASTSVLNSIDVNDFIRLNTNSARIIGSTSTGFRVNNNADSLTCLLVSNSGNCTAAADFRAPIFYDSNNTAFYTDPASTSVLNNVQVTTFGVGTAASGTAGEIRATNNITAYYSDERLKENITTISGALSKLLTLRGVTFNSNKVAEQYGYTDKKEQVGVIAQDVEKVLPQVVVPAPFDIAQDEGGNEYSKSGENYKTVHYDKLVPLLIEAIKELKGEIEELKTKIPA